MFSGGRTEEKEADVELGSVLDEYEEVLINMKQAGCHSMVVTFKEGQLLFTVSEK